MLGVNQKLPKGQLPRNSCKLAYVDARLKEVDFCDYLSIRCILGDIRLWVVPSRLSSLLCDLHRFLLFRRSLLHGVRLKVHSINRARKEFRGKSSARKAFSAAREQGRSSGKELSEESVQLCTRARKESRERVQGLGVWIPINSQLRV